MKNKLILSLLFIASFYFSYSQQVTYNDLIGSNYWLKDPSLQSHSVHFNFKDSFNIDLYLDGKIMNLTYKLDTLNSATLITMNKGKNDPYGPPIVYVLAKKADGSNLKVQQSSSKPNRWDINETVSNTVLMIPTGMVSPPK